MTRSAVSKHPANVRVRTALTLNTCLLSSRGFQIKDRRIFFSSGPVPDRGTDTCARDRRALQQLSLNVHVKHTDLT